LSEDCPIAGSDNTLQHYTLSVSMKKSPETGQRTTNSRATCWPVTVERTHSVCGSR
jgi:hypothetical protein